MDPLYQGKKGGFTQLISNEILMQRVGSHNVDIDQGGNQTRIIDTGPWV